jgi:peroxiredoxin
MVRAGPWDVGPAVGSTVPALSVTNLQGTSVALPELSGKNGLVLVFFRSAKWCPFCQKQLIELKESTGPLAERGYRLAAISYDAADVLKQFAGKWGIPYPLLSDIGSTTIDAWKLRDVRYKPDSFAWGVPYASMYVIAPDGTLKAKLAEEDYKVRPPLGVILSTIDGMGKGRQ